eukprot:g34286.t1
MNRKGSEAHGPNAGKWDEINLGYLVGTDELDRRICSFVVTSAVTALIKCRRESPSVKRLDKHQLDIVILTESYLTNNVPDITITITITITGYVLFHGQDRPSRGGSTVGYSLEGVALGVLNVDSRPHKVSWLQ